ncbi:TIGR00341 family protein [Halomicrobium urmianum]|uniref:TIGR00341 family protein n=1 Tax=Halomicrobium urmianum TaxID=1586233 RepID=UPI001CD9FD96|nr:TIGR00341 family protein [Halomicrobium urmianum]
MRLVELALPSDVVPAVKRTLDDEGIDYYTIRETSGKGYDTIVHFSVETPALEPVLHRLYEAGLRAEDHGVIVDVETDLLTEIWRDHVSESHVGHHARIADAELQTQAANQIMDPYSFVQMTVLSALVATVGLILDSAAAIIGAMVIAPLLGPALSSTVGTVVDDQSLFRKGVVYQVGGVLAAVASASVFAWLLRITSIAPPGKAVANTAQIASRLSPDILSLILALAAGAAGVLSLATRTKNAIIGVMIAAALVPPAATAGIGIAWDLPVVAIDAGILVVVNVLAINLAGLGVFWYLGYRPPTWLGIEETRRTLLKRSTVLLLAILAVSVPLFVTTNSKIQGSQLETQVDDDVRRAIDDSRYEDVTVRSVRVVKKPTAVTHPPQRVVVELGVPPGEHYPQLAEEVGEAVTDGTDLDVGVRVRYVHVANPVSR